MSQQTKLYDLKAHLLDVHNQNIAQNKNKHFCSNAGRWRSEVQKCLRKNDPNQAFTISLYLLQSYAGTEREPTWLWENRSDRKSHKKEEEWLDLLLALNDIVPIPIDLLPDLADWIVDIFNYIPRLLWTKAARLIQRFYFNSQHLAMSLGEHPKDINEASVGEKNDFFYEQIDTALRDLFPFDQKKPPKGSIKKIFTHDRIKEKEASLTTEFEQSLDAKRQDLEEAIKDLSKDEQKAKRKQFRAQMQPQKAEIKKTVQLLAKEFLVEKYGAHAHAHRHGLYLLWLIALVDVRLDTGWRHHIFPGGEKVQSWNPIFDKITDPSCTSVLQTALIDARFFPGISYSSDQIGIIHLPLAPEETREWSIDTLPKHVLLIMDQLIQKKITSKALFQKAQLMDVVFDALERNKAYSSEPTYTSLFHWVSLESSDNVSFEACHYDVLFSWITHFSARPQLKSLLGQRAQYWREQSVESQRIHLRTVITELLTESSYRQLTATQRKSHLFDYFLLTRSNAFYGEKDENYSLSYVFQDLYDQLLFAEHPLTKDSPETLVRQVQDSLDQSGNRTFSFEERHLFAFIVMAIGMFLQEQQTKIHRSELLNLMRNNLWSELYWVKTTENDYFKGALCSENRFHDPKHSRPPKLYRPTKIVRWLIGQAAFRGSLTPFSNQLTQCFLNQCDSEIERYFYMWSIFQSSPLPDIYATIKKNLDFGYHLLDNTISKPQEDSLAPANTFPITRWAGIFEALARFSDDDRLQRILRTEESILSHEPKTYTAFKDAILTYGALWDDLDQSINLLRANSNEDTQVWSTAMDDYRAALACLSPDVLDIQTPDRLDLEKIAQSVEQFSTHFDAILQKQAYSLPTRSGRISVLCDIQTHLPKLLSYLKMKDFDAAQQEVNAISSIHVAESLRGKLPWFNYVLLLRLIAHLQGICRQTLQTEQMYHVRDEYLNLSQHSFIKLREFFVESDLQSVQPSKYWHHVQYVFEEYAIEKTIIESWIDTIELESIDNELEMQRMITQLEEVFFHYVPSNTCHIQNTHTAAIARIIVIILQNQGRLAKRFDRVISTLLDRYVTAPPSADSDLSAAFQIPHSPEELNQALHTHPQYESLMMELNYDELSHIKSRLPFRGRDVWLKEGAKMIISPFIAAAIALTQLLDFGDSLANVLQVHPIIPLGTFILGLSFLLLITSINQRNLGVSIPQALWNAKRNTLWSLIWSFGFALVWVAASVPSGDDCTIKTGCTFEGHLKDVIYSYLTLTFAFTTIIIAATKGIFQIGKKKS